MKKLIIAIFLGLLFSMSISAKEPVKLRDFEAEFFMGGTAAMFKMQPYNRSLGIDFGGELRYNFRQLPLSGGVFVESYKPSRYFQDDSDDYYNDDSYNGGGLYGIFAEYAYNRGKQFSPFASVGFGLGNLHIIDRPTKCTPALRLRIGMELGYHFRISATGTFTKRDLCGYTIGLGFVFGGRPQTK